MFVIIFEFYKRSDLLEVLLQLRQVHDKLSYKDLTRLLLVNIELDYQSDNNKFITSQIVLLPKVLRLSWSIILLLIKKGNQNLIEFLILKKMIFYE